MTEDFISKLRPLNVSDEEWTKVVRTLVSEGARQEKEFHKYSQSVDTTAVMLSNYTDPMYNAYEAAQAPVLIIDKSLERIAGENIKNMTLVKEGVTASGVYIKGWDTAISFQRTQSLADLLLLQDSAFYRAHTDPHGSALVNNFVNFVVGTGVKVTAGNKEVNKAINHFRQINKMSLVDKNKARGLFIDGEYFMVYHPKGKGDLLVRRAPAREIEEIETQSGDKDTILAYKRTWYEENGKTESKWYPDIFYVDRRDDKFVNPSKHVSYARNHGTTMMQFIKWGNDEEIRGRVPMQPILRFMKYYEDWIVDRMRLNHERSKVVWIRTLSELAGPSSSYSTTNPMNVPRGGVIFTETPGIHYRIEAAQISADDVKEDGLAILYCMAAGSQFPLYILTQRIDQQVYASIKKSDNPFFMMIDSWQDLCRENDRDMYHTVVREYVNAGVLPKSVDVPRYLVDDQVIDEAVNKMYEMLLNKSTIEEATKKADTILKKNNGEKATKVNTLDVPIGIHYPPVTKEGALDVAKVLNIYNILGIASKDTLATMAGLDFKKEMLKILAERELGFDQSTGNSMPAKPDGSKPGDTTIDGGRNNADKE